MENIETPAFVDETTALVTVEELAELDGAMAAGTLNTGGTFGTATCPASVGTAFSFTD
jgi:hypothetical protein